MTPVGHSLVGATLAVLATPRTASARAKGLVLAIFVVLANLPDLRLPHWGHDLYWLSHSLPVNLGLIAVASLGLALVPRLRRRVGGTTVLVAGALAWLSHLLLDTFYNHGQGLRMFWPISAASLALPVPWLETLRPPVRYTTPHSLRVLAIELLTFGAIFVAAWVTCRNCRRRPANTPPAR